MDLLFSLHVKMDEKSSNMEKEGSDTQRKFSKFRVTIEPALFGALMSAMIVYLTSQNLILDKACRANLNYSGMTLNQIRLSLLKLY